MNKKIKAYTKKGKTYYRFKHFAGHDVNKKQKYVTKSSFTSVKAAEIALARVIMDIEENGLPNTSNDTFEQVYKEWFEESYKNTVRAVTASRTEDLFRLYILPSFGKMKVKDITPRQCLREVNKWRDVYVKFKALKSYTQNVLDYAQMIDLIKDNPMRVIKMPKPITDLEYQVSKPENFYSANELQEFLSRAKDQVDCVTYTMLHLLAYTGLRKGELLALNWDNINFKDKTLSVTRSLSSPKGVPTIGKPKNQYSHRTITLDSKSIDILLEWKSVQQTLYKMLNSTVTSDESQAIFTRVGYKNDISRCYIDYPNNTLKSFYKNNPDLKRISPHGFRHTHTTLLFESGASIKEVQERLGHSEKDLSITLGVYTHVTKERSYEAVDRLANYMSQSSKN